MLNKKRLQSFRLAARRTLQILTRIEEGERSPTVIANEVDCTRQLADYYIKALTRKEN